MARKAKRLLALLLALLLCVSLLPATALAEGEDEETGTIALVEEPEGERPRRNPTRRPCRKRLRPEIFPSTRPIFRTRPSAPT